MSSAVSVRSLVRRGQLLAVASACALPLGCSGSGDSGVSGGGAGGSSTSGASGVSVGAHAGGVSAGGSAPSNGGSANGGSANGGSAASGTGGNGSSGESSRGGSGSSGVSGTSGSGGVSGAAGQTALGGSPNGGSAAGGGQAAGSGGMNGQPVGSVPVFVALGHVGRTLVSCDDGQTWTLDRDEDPENLSSCSSVDCDHHRYSAKDFTYDAGWFVSTLGWGNPSSVRRSRDGFHWETVQTSSMNADFDNVVGDGAGRFMLLDRYDGRVSKDHAGTWTTLAEIPLGNDIYNIRVAGLGGSKVIAFADQRTIHWTSDFGLTWQRPSIIDADCNFDFYNSGLASGMGRTLTVGTGGKGCYTSDDAETFHGLDTGLAESVGQVIWTGAEFMIWGVNRVARSTNGVVWTSSPTSATPAGTFRPEAVAKASNGAYVAAIGQYAEQNFFRSTDGIAWQRLPSAPKGHPIRKIVAGYAPAALACKP